MSWPLSYSGIMSVSYTEDWGSIPPLRLLEVSQGGLCVVVTRPEWVFDLFVLHVEDGKVKPILANWIVAWFSGNKCFCGWNHRGSSIA